MASAFYHTFLEYGPYAGEIGGRKNGAMIAMTTEKAVAYALGTLQERGALFVEPGTECYEGMLVGERNQPGDMVVNIARTKTWVTSAHAEIPVQLVAAAYFSWRRPWSTSSTTSSSRSRPEYPHAQAPAERHRPQEGREPRGQVARCSGGGRPRSLVAYRIDWASSLAPRRETGLSRAARVRLL